MTNAQKDRYRPINASPVKSFFVSMLTRDIRLEDAILDLLDNCVDGILRSKGGSGPKPYEGFKADIVFSADFFSISDNCGGIPWSLHRYAFRMGRAPGRPADSAGSVGVYGIGMKRAIFKIGKHCFISTRNGNDQYELEINPYWLSDENTWEIPVQAPRTSMVEEGTSIIVKDLYPGITKTFDEGAGAFKSELYRMVSTHYAYIIDKGFEVTINGETVKPHTTKIVFVDQETPSDKTVRPFVFQANLEGVDVFLAIGFARPIPSENEIAEEQEAARYSSVDAGWTVLCNDRAVLHCDRSELTGWGEAGVPRFHNQFIAISGIVDLRSDDPEKLPTTTTKRGIDASSSLYLQIKNKMREGMKMFTDYTNKWKGFAHESKNHIESGRQLPLEELKLEASALRFRRTSGFPQGDQFKPKLPMPARMKPTKHRISFAKEADKVKTVAEYMGEPNMKPSDVGESCFDAVYDEASR